MADHIQMAKDTMSHVGTELTHTAASHVGRDMMITGAGTMAIATTTKRVLTHPLVMLAVGAVAGYYGYKYRKEIAAAIAHASDMGRDFVLDQKERLSDVVEEIKEAEEETPVRKAD